jgi:endo-alpha-1,4-polygalactosaminidase (GH114 family)
MIDAEFRSEEKFSKLSLAYKGLEEGQLVCTTVDAITSKYSIKPETYTCSISKGREVLVIEYQDDSKRESGQIFEEIMDALDIKECS